jgi:hypothetical protein
MYRPNGSLAFFLSIALATTPTLAQSTPNADRTSNAAATHFERGATFYGEGDYGAALVEFKRAYDLRPNWQMLFNIGQSYFQLRDYARALTTLQRFAAEGKDRIAQEDRATLDVELPDLANRVGRIAVTCNLAGAIVSVDDQIVGKTPIGESVMVGTGIHKVVAVRSGRDPIEQDITVVSGDKIPVYFDFQAPPRTMTAPGQPSPRLAARGSGLAPVIASWIVGGAGTVAGSVFGAIAIGDKDSLDRVCTAKACPLTAQSEIDSLLRNGWISTAGFGVGVLGLALGTVLSVVLRPPPASGASAFPVRVQAGPGVVQGTF